MMNFTSLNEDFTRIVEHKHFSQRKEVLHKNVTWITKEYPDQYTKDKEPMYPVNDEVNNSIYAHYKELAGREENVFFGGRLAEYKYYDMHQVIARALAFCEQL